jgi:hypothetical protein
MRISKNQINIRRKVKFIRAQFAEPQDNQSLFGTVLHDRHAEFCTLPLIKNVLGSIQAGLCKP